MANTNTFLRSLLFLGILLLSFSSELHACDVCGGGASLQTRFNQNYLGFSWRYRYFSGNTGHFHGLPGVDAGNQNIDQNFHVAELNARLFPWKWLQVRAWLPMAFNNASEGESEYSYGGLGDAQVLAQYRILNLDTEGGNQHQMFLGAGLKAPSGTNNISVQGLLWEPHYQPGTGSWDFPFAASYYFRSDGSWSMVAEAQYRLNGQNSRNYKYGDVFTLDASAFRKLGGSKVNFFPSLGLKFKYSQPDFWFENQMTNTGGAMVLSTAGLDLWWQKFNAGFSLQVPIWQNWQGEQPYLQVKTAIWTGIQL